MVVVLLPRIVGETRENAKRTLMISTGYNYKTQRRYVWTREAGSRARQLLALLYRLDLAPPYSRGGITYSTTDEYAYKQAKRRGL